MTNSIEIRKVSGDAFVRNIPKKNGGTFQVITIINGDESQQFYSNLKREEGELFAVSSVAVETREYNGQVYETVVAVR
mgnify:CR=1 FL=1